jgi:hypothetical protein
MKKERKIEFVYDESVVLAKIREIHEEVQKIISKSKATFFVLADEKVEIPLADQLYELQAEISNNLGMYFSKLLTPSHEDKKKV